MRPCVALLEPAMRPPRICENFLLLAAAARALTAPHLRARRANPAGTFSLSWYRILPLASSSASARTRTSPVIGQEKTMGPGAMSRSPMRSSSDFFAVLVAAADSETYSG